MRTWIIGVVAFVLGAIAGYAYIQSTASELAGQVSALETQLVQANEVAGSSAAEAETLAVENERLTAESEVLQAELEEQNAQLQDLQTRIGELEAAQQDGTPPEQ